MTKDDISKVTVPNAREFKLHNPQLNAITFHNNLSGESVEVLRISKEGITANPDVPVDAAAAAVIRALDGYIKNLTQRPWVDLSDSQIAQVYYDVAKLHRGAPMPWGQMQFGKALQALIKEKNA